MTPADDAFIRYCLKMPEGESVQNKAFGYTVHRYKDCWMLLIDDPLSSEHLGREFADWKTFYRFLLGDWRVGKPVKLELNFA